MTTISEDLRDSLIGSYIDAHNTGYPEASAAVDDALTHGPDSPHATGFAKALRPLYREGVLEVRRTWKKLPSVVRDAITDGTARPGGGTLTRTDDDAWERGQDSMRWMP